MKPLFDRYQILVIGLLAFIQFTVVLDFMILSPLGVFVMPALKISTSQFSILMSVYAISAGISGLIAAGFADRFDRKEMLLFFYAGFLVGTALCAIAPSYEFLLFARTVTGIFGGVISSISFAIIADLFPLEVRGRVVGFVMTAFAASQILGIPLGMFISSIWGWKSPFWMIVGVSAVVGLIIVAKLKPIKGHLLGKGERNAFLHLLSTAGKPEYISGYAATMLLATGGFMLMPFGSAFMVHNMGVSPDDIFFVYLMTGIVSIGAGPLAGKLADSYGKFTVFGLASLLAIGVLLFYTRMGISPLWFVVVVSCVLFVTITARMISSNALTSGVPDLKDRGAYMSISSSLQQGSGAIASFAAGLIVTQTPEGPLKGYETLGYVVTAAMIITAFFMYRVNRNVLAKTNPVSDSSLPDALSQASEV